MEAPQETKKRTTTWSSNPTPRHISKGNLTHSLKRHLHACVYWSSIPNSQEMETTEVSSQQWMDKANMVHNTMEHYSPWKDKILSFATTVPGGIGGQLSEMTKHRKTYMTLSDSSTESENHTVSLIEVKNTMLITRSWGGKTGGREAWKRLLKGYQVIVGKSQKSWGSTAQQGDDR